MINKSKKIIEPLRIDPKLYRKKWRIEINKACFGNLVPSDHEWHNRAFRNYLAYLNRNITINKLMLNKFKSFKKIKN